MTGSWAAISPSTNADPAFQAPSNWYVTGAALDIAIEGSGYFVLRDPQSAGRPPRLTRSGAFRFDWNGQLIASSGLSLQGMAPDGISAVDLTISTWQSVNGAAWRSLKVTPEGNIFVIYHDDTSQLAGRIALWQPEPGTRLRRWSDDDYSDPGMTDDWRDQLVVPDGVGCRLHSGYLQSPDPELQVVDFHKHRLLDTSSFPMRVGLELCVTLEGPGFLVVRDPKTGNRYLTRCGLMHSDWEGWLVTVPDGYRVQGWTNRVLSLSGDIRVDAADRPAEADDVVLMYNNLQADGSLEALLSNGVRYTRAKLWIARIPHPTLLREVRHGLYATPEGGELESTSEPTFDSTTELKAGSLDPRFLSAERQRWMHRRYQFQQQVVSRTGISSHLAIGGDGFFRLRDPKSGQQILTRSGLFQWSDDGYLEGLHGWRVQGWAPTSTSIEDLTDVRTHHGGRPTTPDQYSIWSSGEVWGALSDGSQRSVSQIVLVHVPDPMILRELEPRHYVFPVEEVDPSLSFQGVPGTQGLGKFMSGFLEAIWNEEFWQIQDLPDDGRLIQLRGLAGRRARIQISDDMGTWTNWMMIHEDGQIQGGRMDFEDPTRRAVSLVGMVLDAEKPQGPARFYRLVLETNSWPWIGW